MSATAEAPFILPIGAEPAWAEPYDAARAYAAGEGWREHRRRTHMGMAADPALARDGWDTIWWSQLRRPSASGSDQDTWFAVWPKPLPGTDTHPCMHFGGWDRADAHGHNVRGAPLRIAVNPGLWRDCNKVWSFGCYWQTYAAWCAPRALERTWAVAARRVDWGNCGPLYLDGEEDAARTLADELRVKRSWTRRSAILATLPADAPNDFARNLTRPLGGHTWEDFQAIRVQERAEFLCWEQAEDDLPWPEFAPSPEEPAETAHQKTRRAVQGDPRPRMLSLFGGDA